MDHSKVREGSLSKSLFQRPIIRRKRHTKEARLNFYNKASSKPRQPQGLLIHDVVTTMSNFGDSKDSTCFNIERCAISPMMNPWNTTGKIGLWPVGIGHRTTEGFRSLT